ncbi:sulfotransferase domain-containing protein [Halopseudomonas salina]|uniref:Sulfotransferase n=1 Tax=Halopseudomonas salina TaxID=1323744 RepID=A0ABQ1PI47_9GAMM|nr:sulfotransferase domain-containing protein [Halopseudomonas salina]GGC97265.1 sulfotransferase [Halopseudomonas salina]
MIDFLVIGSMKSGTTTLHSDLATIDGIYSPANKEPMIFNSDKIMSKSGKRQYEQLFGGAAPNDLKGEFSTTYTMLPKFPGVVNRVLSVIGPELKIIYLVRDPIERARSHIYHDLLAGRVKGNINDLANAETRFCDVSKYHFQLTPWIEAFGYENIKVIQFEKYINSRLETTLDIASFLGLKSPNISIDTNTKLNVSSEKLVPISWVGAIVSNRDWYKNLVKPLLPVQVRSQLKSLLARKSKIDPGTFSSNTETKIFEQIHDDIERFRLEWDIDISLWQTYSRLLSK